MQIVGFLILKQNLDLGKNVYELGEVMSVVIVIYNEYDKNFLLPSICINKQNTCNKVFKITIITHIRKPEECFFASRPIYLTKIFSILQNKQINHL